jgi:Transposase DDE domain
MRHKKSTLKASDVHAYAKRLLREELEMADYSPTLPASLVVSLLLLASCWQTSLSAACELVKDPPCRETARKAVLACLPPKPRDLLARLLAALRRTLPDHLTRVPQVMALDLHQRPYYGNKKGKKKTKGTTKRQKKAGTRNSFTYATLAVLTPWGRFTVGLMPTRPHMRLTTIVETLLKQAKGVELSVSYLMMDKEFYAAEVIAFLQKAKVAFLIPASRKASNKHLYDPKTAVGWYGFSWTADLMRYNPKTKKRGKKGKLTVNVEACVGRNPKDDKPLVYVAWGIFKWSPAQVVQAYRRRFGIEASYRQLNGCLARTSSTSERYRLLLVGVALLLCNLWSYLHSEVFSSGALGETRLELWRMRLLQLCVGVAAHIAALFGGYIDEWLTQRPVPPCFIHET